MLDALVGYSLCGDRLTQVASFIRAANATGAQRLALDIPSGLEGDSGRPLAPCFEAGVTLTLAWPKAGLLAETARSYVGRLYLTDIGVPAAAYRAVGVDPGRLFGAGPVVRVGGPGHGPGEYRRAWHCAAVTCMTGGGAWGTQQLGSSAHRPKHGSTIERSHRANAT